MNCIRSVGMDELMHEHLESLTTANYQSKTYRNEGLSLKLLLAGGVLFDDGDVM